MARHGVGLLNRGLGKEHRSHPQTLAEFARVVLNLFPHGIVDEAPWRPLSKLGGRGRLH